MAVTDAVTAFQTLHAAITGMGSAPTVLPGSLTTAVLPITLTIPGPCTWNLAAETGPYWGLRVYYCRCYVKPIGQDKGPDAGFQDAITLIQLFAEAYDDDITLGAAVSAITEIADGGITVLEYASTQYHGFEYQVTCKETIR